MSSPTRNTVTVRRDPRLDPRLRRKNVEGGDAASVALPPAPPRVRTYPSASTLSASAPSSSRPSSTSNHTSPSNNTAAPSSIMKRRSHSFESTQRPKQRRLADEFHPQDRRAIVEAKLRHRMQSSSTSSISIQSLGRYFLRGYVVHKQKVVRAWQQVVLKMDRAGPLMYHASLQDRLLTAFYCVNDAVGNGRELRHRIAYDFSIFGPSAFFYAGLIATDNTIASLHKMLGVWSFRHYFKDRTINRFCDCLDEGAHFGEICGRKANFDDTNLWHDPSFQKMYNSLLNYCQDSLPSVVETQKRFEKLTGGTGRALADLEPLLKWCKIPSNHDALKEIHAKLLNFKAEAHTVSDDYCYIASVIVQLMMLSRYLKKASKPTKNVHK